MTTTVDHSATISDADLVRLSRQPLAFMFRYVRRHKVQHIAIMLSVILAVGCAVGSSYAVNFLVDTLNSHRNGPMGPVWRAVGLLGGLIAFDNMAWRIGGWISTYAFVTVTGDLRRDLFRHLTGHAPSYFADRMPGTLAGRISATATAMFTLENLTFWNVLPPCLNVAFSILLMIIVSPLMAAVLVVLAGLLSWLMFSLAAGGRPLHHRYATEAARVDGELLDVINNMPLVRAFGATHRERRRFGERMKGEMDWRGRSLRYLEKLRLVHALLTAIMTAGLLVWAILLWHSHKASVGEVVMVTTLGFMILHGTRDLAVALVETIQHMARLAEALNTLLLPHDMPDEADATGFNGPPRGEVVFDNVTYAYPGGSPILDGFNLRVEGGTRVGLVGRSGSGKTTVLALLQRLRYIQGGRLLIDGVELRSLTEEALRSVISVVPQDVSLFHRSVMENIRYGKPEASDDEVRVAAGNAGCSDFIEAMPEGYRTEVGDRGVKLSGGQPPAPGHCTRVPAQRSHPAARRGHQRLGFRERAEGAGGARTADGRPHGDRGSAPALHPARLRPHHRDAVRPGAAGWLSPPSSNASRGPIATCFHCRPSAWRMSPERLHITDL